MSDSKCALHTFTVDDVMSFDPCYTREQVTALFNGRETITLHDALTMDIPATDRVWFACQLTVLPEATRAAWTDRIVTRAVTNHALHCGIPVVESWAARWLNGTDRSRAATTAAWAAATAAWAAAWAAAATAAEAAAAVWAVAATAAWATAAEAAAEAAAATAEAARKDEYSLQIQDLLNIIQENEQ